MQYCRSRVIEEADAVHVIPALVCLLVNAPSCRFSHSSLFLILATEAALIVPTQSKDLSFVARHASINCERPFQRQSRKRKNRL